MQVKIFFIGAFFFCAKLNAQYSEIETATLKTRGVDGYPISNFAVAANIGAQGKMYGNIVRNPGELGKYLTDMGSALLYVKKNNQEIPIEKTGEVSIKRNFPVTTVRYAGKSFLIETKSWCPIAVNDLKTTSLPVLMTGVSVTNTSSANDVIKLIWKFDTLLRRQTEPVSAGIMNGVKDSIAFAASNFPLQWNSSTQKMEITVELKAGETKKVQLALLLHDKDWVTCTYFKNMDQGMEYVFKNWEELKVKTGLFGEKMPVTGDPELDAYLKWYVIPALILTKCTRNNEVLTMGYRELNQRDSYWTSFFHLVFFPDLEKKMIEESVQYQHAGGKIPTTILPVIERKDDVDINCFFILRMLRYSKYYNDPGFVKQHSAALIKALDWVMSRDLEGNGLPQQQSFWFDWKDVKGVKERKYSPYAGLLYLAALKQSADFFEKQNDKTHADKYKKAYKKGLDFINKPEAEGGLWTGDYYRQVFYDGRACDKVQQDQIVGVLFGVVEKEKAEKLFLKLNTGNRTKWGMAETFPYYTADFGYTPATYHNGGIWPWLNFADAWARIKSGRKQEGIELIKQVARADIETDFIPHEDLNSLTGENINTPLQGWNANLFGLVWFELVNSRDFY